MPEISKGSNTSYAKVLSSGDVLLPSSHEYDGQEDQEEPSKPLVLTNLPDLNAQDKMILAAGGMIQKQYRDGYRGSGYVVVDIKSSPNVVFDTLTQIAMYENMIPIVKSSKIISSDGISTVAEFALTSLFIRANVKHTVLPDKRLLKFILDENQINLVVKEAEGFWHVQVPTDRPAGYCRVYLSAQVLTDTMVPPLILDYAVSRALSRATKWLKPFFAQRMNE
jgi:ribosome-associated toxin RatA of RatAB toxin-antitoxin module